MTSSTCLTGLQARPRGKLLLAAGAAACALALAAAAACGGSSAPASSGKVTLTFWSWVPGISQSVGLWNKSHPDIHVNLNEVTSGDAGTYAKMFSALQAGNAPDLGQIEYATLPNFEHVGGLDDLSKYGAGQRQAGLRPVDLVAGDPGQRRLRHPPGHRPDGPVLPRRPVQEVRAGRADDLGAVPERRQEAARRPPERLHRRVPGQRRPVVRRPGLAGRGEVVQHLGRHLGGRHRRPGLDAGRQLLAAADQRSPGEGRAGLRLGVVQGPVRRHPAHLADRGLGREHPGHQRRHDQGRLAGGRRCPTGAPRTATGTGAARPRWCSRTASTRRRRAVRRVAEHQPAEHHRPDHQGRPLPG